MHPAPTANSTDEAALQHDWRIEVQVHVARGNQNITGPGRQELLEAISRCRSISGAARDRGISYRHAWVLVQGMNEAAGTPLVEAAVGGVRGGGAQLTPRGQFLLNFLREFQRQLQSTADGVVADGATARQVSEHVHISAAISLQEVLAPLLAEFCARHPGVKTRVLFGASNELADQLLAGAKGDLFLGADSRQVQRLKTAGLVVPDSVRELARNSVAVVANSIAARSRTKIVDLLLKAKPPIALADPDSPLGECTREYLESLGVYDAVIQRALVVDNSRAVVNALQAGSAQLGLIYRSDAGLVPDARVLTSARTPSVAHYTGAILSSGRSRAEAKGLLDFLTTPAAARKFRAGGFLTAK